METILYGALFLFLFGLYFIVLFMLGGKKNRVSDRIRDYVEDSNGAIENRKRLEAALNERAAARKSLFTRFLPRKARLNYEHRLLLAGSRMTAGDLLFMKIGVSVLMLALLMLMTGGQLLLALIVAILGFVVPDMYITHKISARVKKLEGQIADALVLMANALRSGQSFNYAMTSVVTSMHPPISQEFERTTTEIALGADFEQAMYSLADRNSSEDLGLVINAVLVQRQVGGNLAEVLDRISYTIRERFRIRGEIKTMTSQGRFSAIVVGGLPVGLLLILSVINYSYVSILFTDIRGNILLAIGVFLEIIGAIVLRKMVNIKF